MFWESLGQVVMALCLLLIALPLAVILIMGELGAYYLQRDSLTTRLLEAITKWMTRRP